MLMFSTKSISILETLVAKQQILSVSAILTVYYCILTKTLTAHQTNTVDNSIAHFRTTASLNTRGTTPISPFNN